jgi:hypothetical protein
MEVSLQVASINSCAIVVDPGDNVAVVKTPLASGAQVEIGGRNVSITGSITAGNRFATKPIPAGGLVLQYGQPIGTSLGIAEGDPVSHANMSNDVPLRRDAATSPQICRTMRRTIWSRTKSELSRVSGGRTAAWELATSC